MDNLNFDNKTVLVTGASGFIGSNLVKRICSLSDNATVIGLDNMNDYYDVAIEGGATFRIITLPKLYVY